MAKEFDNVEGNGTEVEKEPGRLKRWYIKNEKKILSAVFGVIGLCTGVVGTVLIGSLCDGGDNQKSNEDEVSNDDAVDAEVTEF